MENVKLFLSQKSQFNLVEKIKNKNKKRTHASPFQSSDDGKQKKIFMWPLVGEDGTLNVNIKHRLKIQIEEN